MKIQTAKAHSINIRHILPFSLSESKQSMLMKKKSSGKLTALFKRIFKHSETYSSNNDEMPMAELAGNTLNAKDQIAKEQRIKIQQGKSMETRSLEDLENCANAARQAGASGQYE